MVVPTYRSGAGLDRLVASVDEQDLQVEIVFVDDGSPDDTFERVCRIAADRANVRAEQIPASGWPSRPRNVGTRLARGEYVLYMDHDDFLMPGGLRPAYEFAAAHGLDAVNIKEVRTNRPTWGLTRYVGDEVFERGAYPSDVLTPMTPHKLYRREFLLEHAVEFPEAPHHLWEDNFFNIDVLGSAQRIGVFSTSPVYHWHRAGGQTGSTDYSSDDSEYWRYVRKVLDRVVGQLADPALEETRNGVLAEKISVRVLSRAKGGWLRRRDKAVTEMFTTVRELVLGHFPPELDRYLDARDRLLVRIVREDRPDLARALESEVEKLDAVAHLLTGRWDGGALHLSGSATFSGPDFPGFRLEPTSDGALRALAPELVEVLGPEARDFSHAVATARSDLVAHDRDQRTGWPVPTTSTPRLVPEPDGTSHLAVDWTATFEVARLACGTDAPDAVWDFLGRTQVDDLTITRRVTAGLGLPPALVHGRPIVPYVNNAGRLTIDVGEHLRTVLADALPRWTRSTIEDGDTLVTPVDGVHVVGSTRLPGTLVLLPPPESDSRLDGMVGAANKLVQSRLRKRYPDGVEVPGFLVGEDGRAHLEARLPAFTGMFPFAWRFGPKTIATKQSLVRWGRSLRTVSSR
ncbi:glycosyltransferase family 2 protein [Cellulosimicrobium terreum]|nr:glycosyltransferase family 2 protein [Cellulosimicrobium terreum]